MISTRKSFLFHFYCFKLNFPLSQKKTPKRKNSIESTKLPEGGKQEYEATYLNFIAIPDVFPRIALTGSKASSLRFRQLFSLPTPTKNKGLSSPRNCSNFCSLFSYDECASRSDVVTTPSFHPRSCSVQWADWGSDFSLIRTENRGVDNVHIMWDIFGVRGPRVICLLVLFIFCVRFIRMGKKSGR